MKKFKKSAPRSAPSAPQIPKGRVVVGIHATRELFRVRPKSVTRLLLKRDYENHEDLVELKTRAEKTRVEITYVSPAELDKIANLHQGVVAYSSEEPELDITALEKSSAATLVVLDEVEDPHNLGAVLRTSWLLGVAGILTPATRSSPATATVSKVSQGAAEHVPIVRESGLLESLKRLKENGFWMYGLSHKGTKSIYDLELPPKVIWVLGSESSGIRLPIERECDELVQIPQVAKAASYNVSVAAGIALGETYRQRECPKP